MLYTANEYVFWSVIAFLCHVIGVLSAISALLRTRTSQSAIAWAISCVTFPYVAVPAYWILGKNRFSGYVPYLRDTKLEVENLVSDLRQHKPEQTGLPDEFERSYQVFEHLAAMPFTRDNQVELIVDGTDFFEEVFERIGRAQDYILLQFFIVRADELGQRMLEALAAKVEAGVRVYFLYDQIGSHNLSKAFVKRMAAVGIHTRAFKTSRGWTSRFQINFRNHRKVVVVDGDWAATGGANLGKEYCGESEEFGYWRDTMVAVQGPAVQEIQISFARDWFFADRSVPELTWTAEAGPNGSTSLLVAPTGPADQMQACSMMLTQAIHSAEKRVWITTPYFVPDNEIVRALQLAALKGVDVRVLMPGKPDHKMVYWASFTYLEEIEKTGVKFYRYNNGMLHEKVMLIDDRLALVGSCNMDNRSFYLNFEMTVLVADRHFASEVKTMLEEDFSNSHIAGSEDYNRRGMWFHLLARLSRLFSPVL